MPPNLPVKLEGITAKFAGNGRLFGYPTANFTVNQKIAEGIYFGYSDLANYEHHPSLIFVGVPRTVGDKQYRIETHLLDALDVDYYNLPIIVELRHFHRTNEVFSSNDQLLKAMKNDESIGRLWFAQNKHLKNGQ